MNTRHRPSKICLLPPSTPANPHSVGWWGRDRSVPPPDPPDNFISLTRIRSLPGVVLDQLDSIYQCLSLWAGVRGYAGITFKSIPNLQILFTFTVSYCVFILLRLLRLTVICDELPAEIKCADAKAVVLSYTLLQFSLYSYFAWIVWSSVEKLGSNAAEVGGGCIHVVAVLAMYSYCYVDRRVLNSNAAEVRGTEQQCGGGGGTEQQCGGGGGTEQQCGGGGGVFAFRGRRGYGGDFRGVGAKFFPSGSPPFFGLAHSDRRDGGNRSKFPSGSPPFFGLAHSDRRDGGNRRGQQYLVECTDAAADQPLLRPGTSVGVASRLGHEDIGWSSITTRSRGHLQGLRTTR